MKLTSEQIRSVTLGAIHVEETAQGICFHRFTPEQEALYQTVNERFYERTSFPAGVRLRFRTDSRTLFIKAFIPNLITGTRSFFSFDLWIDGKMADTLDNFSAAPLPENYTAQPMFPLGACEKQFALGNGEKEVCIHLPYSVCVEQFMLSLDDGASLRPVKPRYRLLALGDSITQGYDALHPSARYSAALADALDAEEICKGIGGERFRPELAAAKEPYEPDYITVAYGTNDWGGSEADFRENSRQFYHILSQTYPKAIIYAISPVWRADWEDARPFGPFFQIEADIRLAIEGLPNVTLIPGFDLIGHDPANFGDWRLHPNDEGFRQYGENLRKAIL